MQIATRYEIQQEIGAGGMGTVYLGVDNQTQQNVAIKQLKPQIAQPHMIERFRREGEALRELNHPNIVKMLDAVEENGNHYLVMEYINGSDLSNVLRKATLTSEVILRFAIDICDALTRAHRLEIIHRDLKPANILIDHSGTALLTDFGVAHIGTSERVTDTDAIIGTVDYLSPEALNGEKVDARTDIWAFGVMLFELLAKERPFKGKGIVDVIHAISTQPVPDLETLCPDAPITLIDLIYRMLEKDRDARIPSMRHIGAALEDIQQGRASSTPATPRFDTPTPEIIDRPKHNLPAQTTPFVGREHELSELDKLLRDPAIRLITVLAPGGMGKTRLSLEATQHALSFFSDGVYFVDLSVLSSAENIVTTLAEALRYQVQGDGREPKQQILDFLAKKNILIVMDNYEHLLDGADLVTEILKSGTEVQILATSRQRLGQPGETLFHLSGMDFPEWETPEDALDYAAVKLFMNSAKRARPDFELTADSLDYVARICRLVQGMPLGIVLAASWLGMLSPQEIAYEISQGIDFLATEEGDLPERQRSIQAVMDYSWHQMTDDEQQVFMKLSIFRGGFTREAAQKVTGASLRLLMSLVNKSLIRRDADSGRYKIHELLRQFSEHKILEADGLVAVQAAHANYYIDLIMPITKEAVWQPDVALHNAVALDFDNVRATWQHMITNEHYTKLPAIVDALWKFCDAQSRTNDGVELLEPLLDQLPADSDAIRLLRGQILAVLSWFHSDMGMWQERDNRLNQSLQIVEHHKATEPYLLTIVMQGMHYGSTGDIQTAEELYLRGYALAQQIESVQWSLVCASMIALALVQQGKYDEALTWADKMFPDWALGIKRTVHIAHGEYEQAKVLALEDLQLVLSRQQQFQLITAHCNLVEIGILSQDYELAWTYLRRGLGYVKDELYTWVALKLIQYAPALLIQQNNFTLATEICAYVANYPSTNPDFVKEATKNEAQLQATLSSEDYNAAWERGKALELESVVNALLTQELGDKDDD